MPLTLCLTQGNPVLSKHRFLECTDFTELLHNLFFTFIIAEYILDAKPLGANLKPQGSLTFSIHLYCSYGSQSASDLMSDVQFPKHTISFPIRFNRLLGKSFRYCFTAFFFFF